MFSVLLFYALYSFCKWQAVVKSYAFSPPSSKTTCFTLYITLFLQLTENNKELFI